MILQSFKGTMKRRRPTQEEVKRRVKRSAPFFFTFANAIFGFLSIISTVEGNFIGAALCILFAAVMDASDGRLARYLDTAGPLGEELDSLCDAISFCLAPTVLLYSWYLENFGHVGLFMISLALYLCSGLFRLARFNLSPVQDRYVFTGLPTTIAAFLCASFILYSPCIATKGALFFLNEQAIILSVALVAFLMISSVKFPAFKGSSLGGATKKALILRLIALSAFLFLCASLRIPLLLAGVVFYIGASLVNALFSAISSLLREIF